MSHHSAFCYDNIPFLVPNSTSIKYCWKTNYPPIWCLKTIVISLMIFLGWKLGSAKWFFGSTWYQLVSPGAIQLTARYPLSWIIYDGFIYLLGISAYVEPGNLAEESGWLDLAKPFLLFPHNFRDSLHSLLTAYLDFLLKTWGCKRIRQKLVVLIKKKKSLSKNLWSFLTQHSSHILLEELTYSFKTSWSASERGGIASKKTKELVGATVLPCTLNIEADMSAEDGQPGLRNLLCLMLNTTLLHIGATAFLGQTGMSPSMARPTPRGITQSVPHEVPKVWSLKLSQGAWD